MTTIAELKEKLKRKGLPVSGLKKDLTERLSGSVSKKSFKAPKIKPNLNKLHKNSLAIFYISLYFQSKKKSKMAQAWLESKGLSSSDASHIWKKIKKNSV